MSAITFDLPVSGPTLGSDGTDLMLGLESTQFINSIANIRLINNVAIPNQGFAFNMRAPTALYEDIVMGYLGYKGSHPFAPFGVIADMGIGDGLFLAPESLIAPTAYSRIYFNVTTAGVGTWDIVVKRFNTTNDMWEIQTLTTDTTNAFRTAGMGYIEFDSSVHGALRLQQQDFARRYWTSITLSSKPTVTTAPKIDQIWLAFDTGVSSFVVSEAGSHTIKAAEEQYVTGSTYYWLNHANPFYGINIASRGADSASVVYKYQYLDSGAVWTDLVPLHDTSNGFSAVSRPPDGVIKFRVRWAIPANWTSQTLSLTGAGLGATQTGYHLRIIPADPSTRVLLTTGQTDLSLALLDRANPLGVAMKAVTLEYLTYDIRGSVPTADVVLGVANVTTGIMRTVTLPAASRNSYALTGSRVPLSSSLVFNDNDVLAVVHLTDNVITNAVLRLHHPN